MFKKVFAFLVIATLMGSAFAQNVIETTIQVGEKTVTGYTLSTDKDQKMVQEAMSQRLKDAKLKTKKSEGYVAALDQVFAEISEASLSLYTKVEEQGKRKDKSTVVTVCAISNDLTISQTVINNNVRNFLQGFATYINKFEAKQNMEAQQAVLKKAQKAADAALSELAGIEKDINSTNKKIEDKTKKIESLKADIEGCIKDISDLQKDIEKYNSKKTDAQKKVSEANDRVKEVEKEVEKYRALSE